MRPGVLRASPCGVAPATTFLLVLLSSACGGSNPSSSTPTPTPTPISYNGSWTGTTGQGQPVSFTVQNNSISRFSLGLVFRYTSLGVECTKTLEGSPNAPIQGSSFSFSVSSGGMTSAITGTLSAPTQASGSYGTLTLASFTCGPLTMGSGSYTSSPQTFSASRQ